MFGEKGENSMSEPTACSLFNMSIFGQDHFWTGSCLISTFLKGSFMFRLFLDRYISEHFNLGKALIWIGLCFVMYNIGTVYIWT